MIGIIGGSGVYEITQKADSCTEKIVETDYGDVKVSILEIFSKKVAFRKNVYAEMILFTTFSTTGFWRSQLSPVESRKSTLSAK